MACATLYVVSQVLQGRKDMRQIITGGYSAVKRENDNELDESVQKSEPESDDSDEEETATKSKTEEDFILLSNLSVDPVTQPETSVDDIKEVIKIEEDEAPFYDPFCLNPLRAGATKAPIAELEALAKHFHPSVTLFANNIVQGTSNFHSQHF